MKILRFDSKNNRLERSGSLKFQYDAFSIVPVHEKYAWRICDFCVANSSRLRRYFPKTLEQNLTPDLSKYFVQEKVKRFNANEEFLFVLKELENRNIIGLIYIKTIDWELRQAELAYCIGYPFEGRGWTSKAIKAISEYAFETLNLRVLRIITHKSNMGSIQVAKKNGYTWQSTLPKEHTPPGEDPLDMELYELYSTIEM